MPTLRLMLALVAIPTLLGSCGEAESGESTVGADSSSDCTRFFVLDDPGWDFHEAIDYPEDLGPLGAVEPSLDWYAEFERLIPSADGQSVEGVSLRLSGHDVGVETFRAELVGFELERLEGDDTMLIARSGAGGQPSVVVRPVGGSYTFMLLSYGLDTDELVEVAAATRSVCEQEWVDAGGQVLSCMPSEPGCVREP